MVIPASSFGSTSASQRSNGSEFTYDVVSIRPCGKGPNWLRVQQTADSFTARCAAIPKLIYHAYPNIIPWEQIVGLPKWAYSTVFAVDAKMNSETASALKKMTEEKQAEERRLMLQAVLAERFKLQVHFEFKERSGYDLVIAKGGTKLEQAKAEEGIGPAGMRAGLIIVKGRPIDAFAELLTFVVGRPVVDKTGLTGRYDIMLRYLPFNSSVTESSAPSIFTAVQESLGLKLIPSKIQLKMLVVDHVEQPSPN